MAAAVKRRMLVMENGSVHEGTGFGSMNDAVCELVFNTSMVGYQEIVTDPSYTAQTVVMTYPLIGNYGITDEDNETRVPTMGGLVVREYCDMPSNFRYTKTLGEILEENGIQKYPDLVIENCSSGGLRMDYALLSRLSIQSTSDQEEYDMYAQISANAATGVYLILRDSQYAEAMVSTFVEAVENTNGIIRNNMGDGKMAFVSRDDCALAAACAAMSDWEDRIVDINGAELLTIAQYMAIASEVTGKKTEYQYINDDEMYEFFDSIGVPRTTEEMWADTAKNFPFCSDGMVSFGRAIRLNQMSTFTDDFEKLTGQKPITVREMFEDMENHLIGTRTSTDN